MNLILAILAAIGGMVLFSTRNQFLVGAIFGVIAVLFWRQLSSLSRKVALLERQIQAGQGAEPAAEAVDEFVAAPGAASVEDPEAEDFIFESERRLLFGGPRAAAPHRSRFIPSLRQGRLPPNFRSSCGISWSPTSPAARRTGAYLPAGCQRPEAAHRFP